MKVSLGARRTRGIPEKNRRSLTKASQIRPIGLPSFVATMIRQWFEPTDRRAILRCQAGQTRSKRGSSTEDTSTTSNSSSVSLIGLARGVTYTTNAD